MILTEYCYGDHVKNLDVDGSIISQSIWKIQLLQERLELRDAVNKVLMIQFLLNIENCQIGCATRSCSSIRHWVTLII